MTEFFMNLVQWFAINKDTIYTFLTSSTFVSILAFIVTIVKKGKTLKDNTDTGKTLIEAIKDTHDYKDAIGICSDTITSVEDKVSNIDKIVNEKFNSILEKVNSMIDVQSLVYSTIKDDTIRNSVSNILTTAKYADCKTRTELENQVAELKARLEEQLNATKELMDKGTEEITKVVTSQTDDVIVRY